jgi:hypothetical protein
LSQIPVLSVGPKGNAGTTTRAPGVFLTKEYQEKPGSQKTTELKSDQENHILLLGSGCGGLRGRVNPTLNLQLFLPRKSLSRNTRKRLIFLGGRLLSEKSENNLILPEEDSPSCIPGTAYLEKKKCGWGCSD